MTGEMAKQNGQIAALTKAQIDLIKKTIAVGATDDELKLFLYVANKRGLDPLLDQIHFVKRKRKNAKGEWETIHSIQTGIDGFRVIADRTDKLSGIKRGVIKNGQNEITGAWAEVYRKDWQEPAREEVSFAEYCQTNAKGEPTHMWAKMPETMIKKCAESAALRMAFPQDLSGLYTHEEMGQAENGNMVEEVKDTEPSPPSEDDQLVDKKDLQAIAIFEKEHNIIEGQARWLLNEYGYKSHKELHKGKELKAFWDDLKKVAEDQETVSKNLKKEA